MNPLDMGADERTTMTKGQPICHWCRGDILSSSPYRAESTLTTYPGVYILVCGPGCDNRPQDAVCIRRSFGQLSTIGS